MDYHPHSFLRIFFYHIMDRFCSLDQICKKGLAIICFMLTISLSRAFIAPHSMLLYCISACSGHSPNISFKSCDSFWYSFYHINCFMDSTCNSSCQNTWKIRDLCESYLLSHQWISFIIPICSGSVQNIWKITQLWNFLFITSTDFLHYTNLICSSRPEHFHVNPWLWVIMSFLLIAIN